MIEIRRILCPCDFSDFSRRALEHATALARWFDAEVTALHAIPVLTSLDALPVAVGPVPSPPVAKEAVHDEMKAFLEPARRQGVRCDVIVAEGAPVDQILGNVAFLPADLIVMGTHGRSGFERWVLGSVTEKVLRKATCPVLTVSQHTLMTPSEERPPFQSILCAVDFSPSSQRALEFALSLAEEEYGRLVLLHVLEALPDFRLEAQGFDVARYRRVCEDDATARLREAIPVDARDWCKPEIAVVHGKAHEQIVKEAAARGSELIVMGVQGRTAIDMAVFGSNTHHVIRNATCPVLTIRSGR